SGGMVLNLLQNRVHSCRLSSTDDIYLYYCSYAPNPEISRLCASLCNSGIKSSINANSFRAAILILKKIRSHIWMKVRLLFLCG
ncbi:hypothetical protein QHH11_04700, partial [Aphanizomenon sp. PH219]|nr:hypothetical protein [Aphanizomenon sp. PH219]